MTDTTLNFKIFLNCSCIPHCYSKTFSVIHVVTTAIELNFNAETGSRLGDQEFRRFFFCGSRRFINIHAKSPSRDPFPSYLHQYIPATLFTIYFHFALQFTRVYTFISQVISKPQFFNYNIVYFFCMLYICVSLPSASSPINEVCKNVFAFQLHGSWSLVPSVKAIV